MADQTNDGLRKRKDSLLNSNCFHDYDSDDSTATKKEMDKIVEDMEKEEEKNKEPDTKWR
ncbi:unnamed protein product [Cylicostephanus goldi]|uniref:Uncharacterized protein n=1 Tax=Cylicostephanus goldi TaxID=71465 RepID=A0A3P6S8J1_CYLGO|nr:unnamed protein product [Cylicostephanus goldi]